MDFVLAIESTLDVNSWDGPSVNSLGGWFFMTDAAQRQDVDDIIYRIMMIALCAHKRWKPWIIYW